jgi:tetratricopeptide (TPR) repeat protein
MLGPDHPDTLVSMLNLASSYRFQRRHADALRLYEETLARQRLRLDPDHPHLLLTMSNLAVSYADHGRHEEALRLREETLALQRRKLGPDHPDALRSMSNLANSYAVLGRHEEALRFREELLARQKARFGADHPGTLQTMSSIARTLVRLDRGVDAVPVIDDVLALASGRANEQALIAEVMDLRLRHFQKARDAAGCRATAEMWENLRRNDAGGLYNAACYRAVTAAVIRETDPSATGAGHADAEADRAMEWLKRAIAAGYKDLANMAKDKDIDALRGRDDFRALLKEMKAGGQEK